MTYRVALALQGGGTHGSFTWGVLDRLLDEVRAERLHVDALSGSSAGAINAALCAVGLGKASTQVASADYAKALLADFWRALSDRAFYYGNPLLGGLFPGFFAHWNLDWSPAAIALEMASLVLSPYDVPFYSNPLAPLLHDFLPPEALQRLNRDSGISLHVCATNLATNQRKVFTQPDISIDTLLASACLPRDFRAIEIGNKIYWDGGFIGNPALSPLVKQATDIIVVTVDPILAPARAPRTARAILDRLNDISGNTPLVLEMNAIHAINKLLDRLPQGQSARSGYHPVHLHLLRDDRLTQPLGFVSKANASPLFLQALFEGGRATAERWLKMNYVWLGSKSSCDWTQDFNLERDVIDPALKGG